MLGLDGLPVVDVHGEIVVLYPLFGDAFEFAGDGILSDFDSGHRHQRFSRFELLPLLWSELIGVKCFLVLSTHMINLINEYILTISAISTDWPRL